MADNQYRWGDDRNEHLLFVRRNLTKMRKQYALPHFHNSIEMVFGLGGSINIQINGRDYELTEGRILFIDRFEPHRYEYNLGSDFYVVVISSSFFNSINGLAKISFPTMIEKSENFGKLRAFLESSYEVRDKESMLYKVGFVNMLVSVMKTLYPDAVKESGGRMNESFPEILRYINENCTENISVISVAKKFGYSPNYLSSIFNSNTGMNFRNYLNKARIAMYNNIRKLKPELPVSSAAELCGFTNLSTFYSALKKSKKDMEYNDHER